MKIKQKVMAILMIILLIGTNLIALGNKAIAANLSEQNDKTNHANVTFDSYFEGQVYNKNVQVTEKTKLYLKIKVNHTGYLKNGIVNILNSNYQIDTTDLQSEWIQEVTKNQIKLKQINSNEEVIIALPIIMDISETIEQNFLEKVTTVSFNATYIDGNGKENNIQKTIENQVVWEAKEQLDLTSKVTKYIPYQKGENYGVLLQTTINSSLRDHLLPIAKTELTMQVPEMKEMKPTKVTVIANQTSSTNGDANGQGFSTDNYNYDITTGNLTIQTTNSVKEDGIITWDKNGVDEYVVNFIYEGKEVYENVKQNGFKGSMQINGKAIIPNSKATTIENQITVDYEEKETKGTYSEVTIFPWAEISKGYLYANYDNQVLENKKETPYEINYRVQINDTNLTEQINLQISPDAYIDGQEKQYAIENSYVKQIKIAKTNFEQILGAEGTIEITTIDGTNLGAIQKDTEVEADGNYVFSIAEAKQNEISLKTSKPIVEGNLEIKVEKALSVEQNYTKEQMRSFSKITVGVIEAVEKIEKKADISLIEPITKAEISIKDEAQSLSTVAVNQNVEIRIILDTSSTENALYKNPTFEIHLPTQIEKIEIKDSNLLLDEELKIKEIKVVEKSGKQVIQISLEGTQTSYMEKIQNTNSKNIISKGANIILNTDITLNPLATTKTESVIMYYTNENSNLYETPDNTDVVRSMARTVTSTANEVEDTDRVQSSNRGIATTELSLVAPSGVIATITSQKNEPNSEKVIINSQDSVGGHTANQGNEIITIGGIITNNHTNSVENVIILGRLPFEGSKSIDEEAPPAESTFTVPMLQAIKTSGIDSNRVQIYYSANGEATKELINPSNEWTQTPSDLSKVKSYLIVVSGEIAQGEEFSFDYQVQFPEKLERGKNSYQMYKVYYDNKTENLAIGQTSISGYICLRTLQGPDLSVKLSSNVAENSSVTEEQIVKFTVEVTNNGKNEAQNVTVNIPIPNGTAYTEYASAYQTYEDSTEKNIKLALGNIKSGETAKISYELKMASGTLGKVEHQVEVTAKDLENAVTSNTYVLNKVGTKLLMNLSIPRDPETALNKGDILYSALILEARETLKNVVVTMNIPSGIKIEEATYQDGNTELKEYIKIENNQVTANIPELQPGYLENIKLKLKVEDFKGDFSHIAQATADGMEKQTSNELIYHIGAPNFTITQNTTAEKYLKEAEQITYEFTIQNTGDADANEVVFENKLPEGLSFSKLQYTYQGKTEVITSTLDNTAKVRWTGFAKGATATVQVIAQADLLSDGQDKTVVNIGTITAQGVETKESNRVTTVIEYNGKLYEGDSGNQGGNNSGNGEGNGQGGNARYKITGTAWLDNNQDGKREETEEILSDIKVMLVQKSNSEIVTDIDNGQEKITTTNQDGAYEFTNLGKGEYLVIFLYDASKYSITEYQEAKVSQSYNSDAISMKITLDGEQTYAGVTDTIKITDNMVRDIDIGLFVAEKFDLRLDKYISKITLTTPTIGTKVYDYENSKLEKVEVLKQNVNNSSMIVEYKIVVTNEGQLSGYAKKIIDYLPEDVQFNSELNQAWYVSDQNNTAYNTSLENTLLKPGESKEITLILNVPITDKNIGAIINNNAEIYESYNEQGVKDMDSIEANRIEGEDDLSKADIILSIVTGKIVIYSTLILSVLFLLILGTVMIKKRVLNFRKIV